MCFNVKVAAIFSTITKLYLTEHKEQALKEEPIKWSVLVRPVKDVYKTRANKKHSANKPVPDCKKTVDKASLEQGRQDEQRIYHGQSRNDYISYSKNSLKQMNISCLAIKLVILTTIMWCLSEN